MSEKSMEQPEKEIIFTPGGESTQILTSPKDYKLDLTSEDDFNDDSMIISINDFIPTIPDLTDEEIKIINDRIQENQDSIMTLEKLKTWAEEGPKIVTKNPPDPFTPAFQTNTEINNKISFWFRGDSSKLAVDGIVNAATTGLWAGPGISGHLHKAAGPEMEKECQKIGHTPTGRCAVTKAYNLPAKYCIHAVGPIGMDQTKLEEAYISTLKCIDGVKIRSIGLCCISTGLYGYPIRSATEVAMTQVRKFLEVPENRKNTDRIVFVVHERGDVLVYSKARNVYFPLEIEYTFRNATAELRVQSDGNISIVSDKPDTDNESISEDTSTDTQQVDLLRSSLDQTNPRPQPTLPSVPEIPQTEKKEKHVTFL